LIIVQAGGVAIKMLGIAGAVFAVLAGEAGDEEQAVRRVRSKKKEVPQSGMAPKALMRWKEESLRMLIGLIILSGNRMR
jgi:hypothetical protein